MLEGNEDLGENEDPDDNEEINLLEQLNKLELNDEPDQAGVFNNEEAVGLKEASKGYLNISNPVFSVDRESSKVSL